MVEQGKLSFEGQGRVVGLGAKPLLGLSVRHGPPSRTAQRIPATNGRQSPVHLRSVGRRRRRVSASPEKYCGRHPLLVAPTFFTTAVSRLCWPGPRRRVARSGCLDSTRQSTAR